MRDLSEVDEGNFSQVPYIGTPLERQIRAITLGLTTP
jgi:hypothetical protein